MAWNDQRATLSFVQENGPVEDIIQGFDLALNAAAVFDVDKRKLNRVEDITRGDNIGLPELNNAVAIGDRVRFAKNLDRVPVVIFPPAIVEKRVARPTRLGQFRLHHASLHVLLSDDGRGGPGIPELHREEGTHQAGILTRGAKFYVAASAVGKEAGVDDKLNWLVAELVNRLDHFVRELAGSAVNDKRPLIARLHHDVPAISQQDVDVAGNRKYVYLAVVRFRIHRSADRRGTRRGLKQCFSLSIGCGFKPGGKFWIDGRCSCNSGQ